MTLELVKKLKQFADDNNLVMRIFCDNAMIYHYNASNTEVSFNMDESVFYAFKLNLTSTSTGLPVELDIVDFDQIQGIRFHMKNNQIDTAITSLSIPDVNRDKIDKVFNDEFNRFDKGTNPYLYGNSPTTQKAIETSKAVAKQQ